MDKEVYEKYKRAGEIAAEARDIGVNLIKPGVSFLEVAKKVESHILENGAQLSFPVNISVNDVAAHFTPRNDDTNVFKRGDVVKLDVGSHVDGYIADTAVTIEVGTHSYDDMITASEEALNAAIELMKPGVNLSDIGKAVETTITSYGYKPIENLTGHSLNRYVLHAGMSIPNVPMIKLGRKPKRGDAIAIEPFATDGAGHVVAGKGSNIYIVNKTFNLRGIRDKRAELLFHKIKNTFKTFPFAHRWCTKLSSNVDVSLQKLSYLGFVKQYPQLVEQNSGIVTQKEHTVIVTDHGCEVLTYGRSER